MKSIVKVILFFFLQMLNLNGSVVNANSKYIEVSTDTWIISLPESWKPEVIDRGIKISSEDGVFFIFIATYDSGPLSDDWAQKDLEIVKDSKLSDPDRDFKYMQERIDLESDIQSFVIDAYDEESSYRVYAKHFRVDDKLVTLSIYDNLCESYEESYEFIDNLLKGFKIKI